MIRGQPRTTVQSASSSARAAVSPPVVPSQPRSAASTPASRPSSSGVQNSPNVEYNRYSESRHNRQNSAHLAPISGLAQRRSYHGSSSQANYEPTHAAPSHYYGMPAASYSDPSLTSMDVNAMYPSPNASYSPSSLTTPDAVNFDPFSLAVPAFAYESQPQSFSSISGQNAVQQEHVLYYFEHVRKMQFIFASNSVTNITVRKFYSTHTIQTQLITVHLQYTVSFSSTVEKSANQLTVYRRSSCRNLRAPSPVLFAL